MCKKMKKKNGFTLIELLAVIIILGILMIIAIPSVTKYISDSRKNSYVDTAKEVIGSARNLVNSGELEMYDTDATYYIDVNCIKTENAMKSPYGDFVKEGAYVVVTYDGKGYDYFWTSVDDAGQGVKNIVKYDKLDTDDISSDLTIEDISTLRTLDGRGKVILITERNSCKKEGPVTENLIPVNSETGEEGGGGSSSNAVVYPTGKTKDTVVTGDIVTIDTEEFYVISNDGTDLVLLAHYNLKVGNIYNSYGTSKTGEYTSSDTGYGLQSNDARGAASGNRNGVITFSSVNYWNEKVGSDYPNNYCTSISETNCAYVYDSNSVLYQYVEAYKEYLISKGAPNTIEARLMTLEEANAFKNAGKTTELYTTSFWLGSAYSNSNVWYVNTLGNIGNNIYTAAAGFGVRPVIII